MGGKGLGGGAGLRQTTGKANRVLGQKDHNLGKSSTGQSARSLVLAARADSCA